MNEKFLTGKLIAEFNRSLNGAVVLKHTDQFTSGVPDLSVTWGGATTWIEVKVVRRGHGILGRGAQTLTMQQMERAGSALYVVYHLDPEQTFVVLPGMIYGEYWLSAESSRESIDHHAVVEHIRRLHLNRRTEVAS